MRLSRAGVAKQGQPTRRRTILEINGELAARVHHPLKLRIIVGLQV